MKICTKCSSELELSEFGRNCSRKDGHTAQCKSCSRVEDRERYQRDPEKRRAQVRKTYATNEGYREKVKSDARKWERANPEKVVAKNARLYQRDGERIRVRNRSYQKANKPRFAALAAARRARALRAEGGHTADDRLEVLRSNGGLCAYCNENEATTVDHIIPLKRGGSNSKKNLWPACQPCNSSKHVKLVEEWRKAS
jgi:5-methylcytosine-specific restriction endonuclease McrA